MKAFDEFTPVGRIHNNTTGRESIRECDTHTHTHTQRRRRKGGEEKMDSDPDVREWT